MWLLLFGSDLLGCFFVCVEEIFCCDFGRGMEVWRCG